jgi:hypothetical protein
MWAISHKFYLFVPHVFKCIPEKNNFDDSTNKLISYRKTTIFSRFSLVDYNLIGLFRKQANNRETRFQLRAYISQTSTLK